ncbi:MAG: hypothetical protein U0800_27035 [Isosphaeraceae bacterium]
MPETNRREFSKQALRSLMAVALIDGLQTHRLFGRDVAPIVDDWFNDLNRLSQELKDQKLKDLEFQAALEKLYARANLPDLLKSLDFDRIARGTKFKDKGETSLPVDFSKVEGIPTKLVFGRQFFALKKGRSVVPHGHDNMATGFLILDGKFRGRHWDRVEDEDDHYIIKPTIDKGFGPGGYSTVSDHKDNVHWFTAESDTAFIFNIHVMGIDPESDRVATRVYIDPNGEKLAGGLVRAPKITSSRAHELYG